MTTWEERAQEARDLAPQAEVPTVAARLLDLLLDEENTAVSQAAADVLLARQDKIGIALFAQAFERADEDTRNKLSDCLWDDEGVVWSRVEAALDSLGAAGDRLRSWMEAHG